MNKDKRIYKNSPYVFEDLDYINSQLNKGLITLDDAKIINEKYKLLLFGTQDTFRSQLILSWSQLLSVYKDYNMFDTFIETFLILEDNETFISEINRLYLIYGDYYFKYLSELKESNRFCSLVNKLEKRYNNLKNNSIYL